MTELDDKYTRHQGRVFLSGVQALVRLPLLQRQRDAAAGLDTAGFISGYRGSPLGGYDSALWKARGWLEREQVRFEPGLNEDLAATAVWGTQQVSALPGAKHDGVFALWYGKGPGVDRSGDPMRHANLAGTSKHGGVLAVFGDDHAGKSSTTAHQSEPLMAALGIPVLYPASVQEYIDLGLFGWALSRYSGLWIGFKCVSETVESTATVEIDGSGGLPVVPAADEQGIHLDADSLHRIAPLATEKSLVRQRLPRVHAFVRANALDRVVIDGPSRAFGIVAAGKSYLDVRHALQLLGIDDEKAARYGIGLYKPALIWPLEPEGLKSFSAGRSEVLFVEDKRGFIEDQAARILYGEAARPAISGKTQPDGTALLAADGALDASTVALALGLRLKSRGLADADVIARMQDLERKRSVQLLLEVAPVSRTPWFCSGCPHNRSTVVPAGSLALGGIGCHGMAVSMDRALTPTHMGGEGMNWVGMAPFTTTSHVFQNLGDGTYAHSGALAIRGAIAAKARLTYKILFNDAVAMTGGQPVEGQLTVAAITNQLAALGVRGIRVVTDEPAKYGRDPGFAAGTSVHHRTELEAVQRELAAQPAVTALIFDQTCAAEKRRRRKRGKLADPPKRAFINAAVCEGCGDCSVKSNCVSVEPLETELGRKRQINQSSCNKDMSCIEGFCPSFVTVEGGRLRRAAVTALPNAGAGALPEPPAPCRELGERAFTALIVGVGGSGIVTIGAVLGMAAHLEGKGATVYDMTGLAQKGGSVLSHLKIAARPDLLQTVSIGPEEADVMLGCDLLVAASRDALRTVKHGVTRVVLDTHLVPTGAFQRDAAIDFQAERTRRAVEVAAGESRVFTLDAAALAQTFAGDALAANMMMVGCAYQLGTLPLAAASIERALELNGVAVDLNKRAFALGRQLVHCPQAFTSGAAGESDVEQMDTPEFIRRRADDLVAYQDAAYARRFQSRLANIEAADSRVSSGHGAFTRAVARAYFKLLAYKDEYEVGRLYTDGRFEAQLRTQFEGDFRPRFHFAPPILAKRHPVTGEPMKRSFGPWMRWPLKALARLSVLRGTPFDVFGYSADRRLERALVREYEATLDQLTTQLHADNYAAAVELASLPLEMRGYGDVKARNVELARARARTLRRHMEELPAVRSSVEARAGAS